MQIGDQLVELEEDSLLHNLVDRNEYNIVTVYKVLNELPKVLELVHGLFAHPFYVDIFSLDLYKVDPVGHHPEVALEFLEGHLLHWDELSLEDRLDQLHGVKKIFLFEGIWVCVQVVELQGMGNNGLVEKVLGHRIGVESKIQMHFVLILVLEHHPGILVCLPNDLEAKLSAHFSDVVVWWGITHIGVTVFELHHAA